MTETSYSPDEENRDQAQAIADDRQLREEDWLDWTRMDRTRDALLSALWDSIAWCDWCEDRLQRIVDGDPELLLSVPTVPHE